MKEFVSLILTSGFVAFLATPIVRNIAHATQFVAMPNPRSSHRTPTPLLGGLAIYVGLVVALAISGFQPVTELAGVIIGMTLVMGVGLWDDRYGTHPLVRISIEGLAAICLILAGIQVNLFALQWINWGITVIWVIALCNAINLQDNMDGLAAGLSMIACAFFLILAVVEELNLVATLAAATFGACVAFLYFNFNPATLFMGDTGALLLGFVLAVLGIRLEFSGQPIDVTWVIPIIILGMPIFDTALVILSRIRRRQPIYVGGRDHTSHRLVMMLEMTHARAVMTLYMVSGALGLTALLLSDLGVMESRAILLALIATSGAALLWLEWSYKEAAKEKPAPPTH